MHAVRAQQIAVVLPRLRHFVIDPHGIGRADGARQRMWQAAASGRVVVGQQRQPLVAQPVQTRIADMQPMRLASAQHQRGQRRRHPRQRGIGVADAVDPAVHRIDAAGGDAAHAQRLALFPTGLQKAAHRDLRRDAPALGAADAIRDSRDRTQPRALLRRAQIGGRKILIVRPTALLAGKAAAQIEANGRCRHRWMDHHRIDAIHGRFRLRLKRPTGMPP
jgi:hypothetical protein